MKKSTWIKTAQIAVSAIPPIIVLCVNFPIFTQSTNACISAATLLVGIICACIFKDATKKIFQTPSAFKTCVIMFILSYIAVSLGEQILLISATALVSGACGIPLGMWYNYETQPATTDDIITALKDVIKGTNKNGEKSDKTN